jgi:hypothetical protein
LQQAGPLSAEPARDAESSDLAGHALLIQVNVVQFALGQNIVAEEARCPRPKDGIAMPRCIPGYPLKTGESMETSMGSADTTGNISEAAMIQRDYRCNGCLPR